MLFQSRLFKHSSLIVLSNVMVLYRHWWMEKFQWRVKVWLCYLDITNSSQYLHYLHLLLVLQSFLKKKKLMLHYVLFGQHFYCWFKEKKKKKNTQNCDDFYIEQLSWCRFLWVAALPNHHIADLDMIEYIRLCILISLYNVIRVPHEQEWFFYFLQTKRNQNNQYQLPTRSLFIFALKQTILPTSKFSLTKGKNVKVEKDGTMM